MLRVLAVALLLAAVLIGVQSGATANRGGEGSAIEYERLPTPLDAGGRDCGFHGPFADACVGESACWINDPAALQHPAELADVQRPRPDDHVAFMSCVTPSGDRWARWYWSSDRASLAD